MADPSPSVESVGGDSRLQQQASVHGASDEQRGGTGEGKTTSTQRDVAGSDALRGEETITFRSTSGGRYVWPFELCRSFDAIKPLLREAYAAQNDDIEVVAINAGWFDILTNDGSIILPSVWSSIVKPSSTISIRLWPEIRSRPPDRVRRHNTYDANVRLEDEPRKDNEDDVFYQDVAVDVGDPQHSRRRGRPASVDDASEDGLDSLTSSEGEDEEPVPPPEPPEPVREVVPPLDGDGNKLSYEVNTKSRKLLMHSDTQPRINGTTSGEPGAKKDVFEHHLETLRITRVMSTKSEGRSMVQVHVLPGPENIQLRQSVTMTWYHVALDRLDFTRFRNVCLAVPHLSDRLKTLTRELLGKIEKEKVNVFLDGMFIEPGTVLRADEKNQPDPQSVIFSCIPYFDLQAPTKKPTVGSGDRLFPARTLMQSYYPYEPVRERDDEQAYRKFGNDRSVNIIHVPSFWTMNIGGNVVVTCGHKPLSEELVKSITVVKEDLKQLGVGDIKRNTLTKIKFTDWDGRVILFSLEACRSYFEMEQKLRELRCTGCRRGSRKSMRLHHRTQDDSKTVTPRNWKDVVSRTDLVSIDLNVFDNASTEEVDLSAPSKSVPPFFHWPRATCDGPGKSNQRDQGIGTAQADQPEACLEQAEKAIISETLDEYDTTNAVDKTFTSAAYYHSLPAMTHENAGSGFVSFMTEDMPTTSGRLATFHDITLENQCSKMAIVYAALFKIVDQTIGLFATVDHSSTLLCKVWYIMVSMRKQVEVVKRRVSMELDPDAYSASEHHGHDRGWCIRSTAKDSLMPLPDTDAHFKKCVQRCKRCRSLRPFDSPDAALEHLRKHAKPCLQPATPNNPTSARAASPPAESLPSDPDLQAWILSSAQYTLEETNAGALKLLAIASTISSDLFTQAKELSEGVQNEDGHMSDLYTLPSELLVAFRKIVVFYIAIERALYYTMEACDNGVPRDAYEREKLPYSESGLEVLKRFGEGARQSLVMARQQLCRMVRSVPPLDVFQHTSLGPEYVCAWLMRRLLVQPLEKRMTVADMYREYLSTIQFQVNHRPNKRLLRTINLLQEELQILLQINTWQTTLIQNYLTVLDHTTYPSSLPTRQAMFPHERRLLTTCLDNLDLARQDYTDLLRRCGPLSDRTKQSLEINEEDHGKAIMVFTIVTVIFLPLSFVTSFFGMNTSDLRDMDSRQSLFWAVAIPLTVGTVGTCLLVGYNGDEIRDAVSDVYRNVVGKQGRSTRTTAQGISFAQRKNVGLKMQREGDREGNSVSMADEAEFASPREEFEYPTYPPPPVEDVVPYSMAIPIEPRSNFRQRQYTEHYDDPPKMRPKIKPPEFDIYGPPVARNRHVARSRRDWDFEDDKWYRSQRRFIPPPVPTMAYGEEDEEYEPGRPTEYTWHRKRKTRHVRRSEGFREREMDNEGRGERDGYGVPERGW